MRKKRLLGVVAMFWLVMTASAQQWTPKQAPLMTKFAKDVDPENVLPEYPRPQMVRKNWKNLNGLWQFQPGTWENEPYPKGELSRNILVPFAVESALSGVQETHERIWYRREFTVPADWQGKRILLHFGAVDYEATVFINDRPVGKHQGGYDPFTFDITDHLTKGTQTITVKVWDPTTREGFPRGKQALNNEGIMYTSVTGIWQTVWLEPVPEKRIVDFEMVPDIDRSELNLSVETDGGRFLSYTAEIKDGDKVVATVDSKPMKPTAIAIKNQKLWSPDSPFLYDMTITLRDGDHVVDVVDTYFGMRKISVEKEGEFQRLYLNNEFVFQMGPLDQGFWPDGLYTAPTDEALRYDLEKTKELGFNMTRKHIKVEPQRWYYWADKLGLMVWQDMPSPNSYTFATPEPNKEAFTRELMRMVETHKNSPSIVMWVIFNESQAQHDTERYAALVKGLDPSRVVNEASGGTNHGAADVADVHSYPPPAYAQSPYQATVCGEYGGIGYQLDDHIWNPDDLMQYVTIDNEEEYVAMYDDFADMLVQFKTNQGMSAAVYTEITDVEIELNGIMTYDRVMKVDPKKIARINQKIIEEKSHIYPLVLTAKEQDIDWQYTFSKPKDGWEKMDFEATGWKIGQGGFGSKGTPGAINGTTWQSEDIWLRRSFELGNIGKINLDDIRLRIHHDDECVVYINGVKAAELEKWTSSYTTTTISDEAKNALVANGTNVIAIHCKQDIGGQYIDAGLSIATGDKALSAKTLESVIK
ncbi:glycoside hydrolase family 2 [Echinicola soli]|uniref:Glycoside hydrolase family 2 n=1 Tax=Echinicola soli TaxID=2591634 RepID=A0A514CJ74_9BACT|nr:sugar-binding domain-containing protein [Echinicola soli]QDH79883.1 glycoside hydrolase family 2 [Echinicola soli]